MNEKPWILLFKSHDFSHERFYPGVELTYTGQKVSIVKNSSNIIPVKDKVKTIHDIKEDLKKIYCKPHEKQEICNKILNKGDACCYKIKLMKKKKGEAHSFEDAFPYININNHNICVSAGELSKNPDFRLHGYSKTDG